MTQPIDPLRHRSKSDIKKWLMARDWYERYVENLKGEYQDINQRQKFLLGDKGAGTISSAFLYSDTPEGTEYWAKVEEQFLKWYYLQD